MMYWECYKCKKRFIIGCTNDYCTACGGVLVRTIAKINLNDIPSEVKFVTDKAGEVAKEGENGT